MRAEIHFAVADAGFLEVRLELHALTAEEREQLAFFGAMGQHGLGTPLQQKNGPVVISTYCALPREEQSL